MHELSLTQSILDIVEEYSERHNFSRVHSLRLSFGRMSCIDTGALDFAFAVQSEGTKAEGATLKYDIRPVVIHCFTCGRDYEVDQHTAACPACGGAEVMVTGGTEELQLVDMDVD